MFPHLQLMLIFEKHLISCLTLLLLLLVFSREQRLLMRRHQVILAGPLRRRHPVAAKAILAY